MPYVNVKEGIMLKHQSFTISSSRYSHAWRIPPAPVEGSLAAPTITGRLIRLREV